MLRWFHRAKARLTGRNSASTPKDVILAQMSEPRPLPMGRKEFDEWSDRIIGGAMIKADKPSLRFALAEMIMHIKPTESHCSDAYFIQCLRKGAANQVAFAMMEEIRNERKAALAKAEEEAKLRVVHEAISIDQLQDAGGKTAP